MKHTTTLLTFQCRKGKIVAIKNIRIESYKCKELALAEVLNQYGISYTKEIDKQFICCNFQFGWEPTQITVAVVSPLKKGDFGFSWNIQDKDAKRRLDRFIGELIVVNKDRDYGAKDTQYPDQSLQMSDWHWQHTLPKGHRILEPGETILESDREYEDISSRNKLWKSSVSWYNIGKVVEEGHGWSEVDKSGKVINSGGKESRPLICRKITNP